MLVTQLIILTNGSKQRREKNPIKLITPGQRAGRMGIFQAMKIVRIDNSGQNHSPYSSLSVGCFLPNVYSDSVCVQVLFTWPKISSPMSFATHSLDQQA